MVKNSWPTGATSWSDTVKFAQLLFGCDVQFENYSHRLPHNSDESFLLIAQICVSAARRVSAWQVRSGCFKPHIFVLFFSMFGSVQLTLFKRLPFFPTSLCGVFVFTCVSRRSSPFHVIRIQAKINSNSHTPTCAIQFTQLDSHHPTHTTQLNSHNRCLELLRARSPVGRKHFGLQSLFPVEYLVPPQLLLCGRCSALTALVPRAFCVAGAMASSWCLCSCFCMTGAAPSALSMELLFCVENLLRAWLPCIPERFSVAGAALCAPLAR